MEDADDEDEGLEQEVQESGLAEVGADSQDATRNSADGTEDQEDKNQE